jgi:polyisoprenoid-binding protein YceI
MLLNPRSSLMGAFAALLAVSLAQAAPPAPPVEYTLDPARSSLKFAFTQDKAENQGRFRKYDVKLRFVESNLAASRLDAVIDVGSLDTGDEERDAEMRGVNGFDVAKFPEAKFHTVRFSPVSAGRYEAIGKLTLHGVTRELRVPLAIRAANEKAGPAAYVTGRVSFNRLDFGVGQGQYKATDFIGNEVSATFGLRFSAKAAAPVEAAKAPPKTKP